MKLQYKLVLASLWMLLSTDLLQAQQYADSLATYYAELAELRAREQAVEARIEFLRRHVDFSKIGAYTLADSDAASALVEHSAMVLNYDEASEGPEWVAHIIYPMTSDYDTKRKNNFKEDEQVTTQSATAADYRKLNQLEEGITYDRGHMAPSADFDWWQKAMDESFYYSNMSPQLSGLNRNKWRIMEELLRDYANKTGNLLYVATGPVFTSIKENPLADSGIDIPGAYYKVVVDPILKRGIGFVLPNETVSTSEKLIDYYYSIDDIEDLTGIDFFVGLEDRLESFVEGAAYPMEWLPAAEIGVIPVNQLPAGIRNTADLNLLADSEKIYSICGGVEQVVENSKTYTLYLTTEYKEQPLVVSISKAYAGQFSSNFTEIFKDNFLFVRGVVKPYRGKYRVVVEQASDFGLIRL